MNGQPTVLAHEEHRQAHHAGQIHAFQKTPGPTHNQPKNTQEIRPFLFRLFANAIPTADGITLATIADDAIWPLGGSAKCHCSANNIQLLVQFKANMIGALPKGLTVHNGRLLFITLTGVLSKMFRISSLPVIVARVPRLDGTARKEQAFAFQRASQRPL